jgi:hypothetical protein
MLARTGLDLHEALVCTMVLLAAADNGISDREIGVMAGLVQTLPVFEDFSAERLRVATEAAVALLEEEDGLDHATRLIHEALAAATARDRVCAGMRGGRGRGEREPAGAADAGDGEGGAWAGPAGVCRDRAEHAGAVSPGRVIGSE